MGACFSTQQIYTIMDKQNTIPKKINIDIDEITNVNVPQQTSPQTMKQNASQQELQMVLNHYQIAQNKDIEQILFQNECHVLRFRDKIYSEAKRNGITSKSNDNVRLKIVEAVVEYAFMNIEPPNEYTKQTDRKHFKDVARFSAKFCEDKNMKVPITLICAAWYHDIERFIPSIKCKYLPESVDKYRKQVIHPITSAKIARVLLSGAPITPQEIDRIHQLIVRHDQPNPQKDIIILNQLLIEKADDDLLWELECLMDGDAFAFFESTIPLFITCKSTSNSPDWIWERVTNNVKRLQPHLQPKAAECINNLSKDLLSKMSVNYDELNCLCLKQKLQQNKK